MGRRLLVEARLCLWEACRWKSLSILLTRSPSQLTMICRTLSRIWFLLQPNSNRAQFLFVSDFILVVGGYNGSNDLGTVEVVSLDGYAVPDCMKNLNDFPKTNWGAVGTTFGMFQLRREEALSVVITYCNQTKRLLVWFTTADGTSLLKANFDLHFFNFQEMSPLSAEVSQVEESTASAGNMMEQIG